MGLAKTFLAIGIAVLLAVFIGYGLYTLYPSPQYGYVDTSSCLSQYVCQNLTAKCDTSNSVANDSTIKAIPAPYNDACYQQVYASAQYQKCMTDQQKCTDTLNQSSENYFHARNSFYILIVLGILAIIAGALITKEGIGSGFIGGGILIVLWSLPYTSDYWTTLNKFLKLAAVGVVLILLIYLGYKKIEGKFSK